jgi:NAD(P)-dependent dehydrogenase (short-subunit alcohol dehydrogenase family)
MNPVKSVLVSGAGAGVGRAIAAALGGAGLQVAVNDINPDRAAETARRVEAAGGLALVHIADISKKFPVQAMFNAVEDAWGRLDGVVNCTRVLPQRAALEMDEWDWRRTLDVNLTGAFLLTQVGGRVMRPSGGGSIVHVLESPAERQHAAAVSATRAGLLAFTAAAEAELAEAGIRLAAVEMGADGEQKTVSAVLNFILRE